MEETADKTRKPPKETPKDAAPKYSFAKQLDALKGFWVSDQKWKARLLLGGILALTVAEIGLAAGVAFGSQFLLNALVAKSAVGFAVGGGATLTAMGAAAYASNKREYMTNNLGQHWRGWLTKQFTDAWLDGKTYLRLQHSKKFAQNPDQRIAETIMNVTGGALSLGLGAFRSVVGVVTFSAVLWQVSPLLVGAAVVAAGTTYGLNRLAGGSLNKVWRGLMDAEGKFRQALSRIRGNAKTIALTGYETVEKETLQQDFKVIDEKRQDFFKAYYHTGIVNSLSMNSMTVVPIALTAPKFFAGTATLGGLELARQTYGQFYNALGWFPQAYSQIANWQANLGQMIDFKRDLEENKLDILKPLPATPALELTATNPKTPALEDVKALAAELTAPPLLEVATVILKQAPRPVKQRAFNQ